MRCDLQNSKKYMKVICTDCNSELNMTDSGEKQKKELSKKMTLEKDMETAGTGEKGRGKKVRGKKKEKLTDEDLEAVMDKEIMKARVHYDKKERRRAKKKAKDDKLVAQVTDALINYKKGKAEEKAAEKAAKKKERKERRKQKKRERREDDQAKEIALEVKEDSGRKVQWAVPVSIQIPAEGQITTPQDQESQVSNIWLPKIPPPSMAGGFGSRLYPRFVDYKPTKEAEGIPPYLQIAEECKRRICKEADHMFRRQSQVLVNRGVPFRSETRNGKPYCEICSSVPTTLRPKPEITWHHHYSSKEDRLYADYDQLGQYNCDTCRISPHVYKTGERVALIVTGSQMANWQNPVEMAGTKVRYGGYPGDDIHVDSLAVPGAKVSDLKNAFLAEYEDYDLPLDILIIAGTNNLIKGQTKEQVLHEMETFKNMVVRMGEDKGWRNTFGVCDMFYPPKLTRFAFDPIHGDSHFWNRAWDIRFINDNIRTLNNEGPESIYTRHTPTLHHIGIKKLKELPEREWMRNYPVAIDSYNKHVGSAFREMHPDDMLHLSDYNRIKAGAYFSQYYRHIYGADYYTPLNRYEEKMEQQIKAADEEREKSRERTKQRKEEDRLEKEKQMDRDERQRKKDDSKQRQENMKRREKELIVDLILHRSSLE